MEFLYFFASSFFDKVPVVAVLILLLILCSVVSLFFSFKNKKLNSFSQFAPTILTTAGLFGTFVGLTMGLKGIEFKDGNLDIQSFANLMENLKAVFVYALSGVLSSLVFMLLNTFVLRTQNRHQLGINETLRAEAARKNHELLEIQRNQEHELSKLNQLEKKQLESYQEQLQVLMQLGQLQQKQLESQKLMQQDISKLQFENDNQQLAQLISSGVVKGLTPLLQEIKTAVADQGTEAIKKVLEDLKEEILVPMNGALSQTNSALKETTDAVKATIIANQNLITVVGDAATKMENASDKMNGLVGTIDQTVQHMESIQKEQKKSLETFNKDLKDNLAEIKPAIEKGLESAERSLSGAITAASQSMQTDIRTVLTETGKTLTDAVDTATKGLTESITTTINKQNDSINESFKKFDEIQIGLNAILKNFSKDMNDHLDRMATELKEIGTNSKNLIDTASTNLKETLGNIDDKLLNTAKVLENSLETFRIQYEKSLTEYLEKQTQNLNGFLDDQNKQLEQTIGQQREGLVEATNRLTTQFNLMNDKQKEINDDHTKLIKVINGTGLSILPKVDSIARELNAGEQKLSQDLARSSQHLEDVSTALENLGKDLPPAFVKAFEQLNKNYQESFNDLDRGLKDAVNRLGSTVGALAQAIHLHDAMTQ